MTNHWRLFSYIIRNVVLVSVARSSNSKINAALEQTQFNDVDIVGFFFFNWSDALHYICFDCQPMFCCHCHCASQTTHLPTEKARHVPKAGCVVGWSRRIVRGNALLRICEMFWLSHVLHVVLARRLVCRVYNTLILKKINKKKAFGVAVYTYSTLQRSKTAILWLQRLKPDAGKSCRGLASSCIIFFLNLPTSPFGRTSVPAIAGAFSASPPCCIVQSP